MKTNRITAIMLALVSIVSCQHKELCYSHPHNGSLKVVFDWSEAQAPEGENMELFLFSVGGGHPLHYQFYNMTGGTINVPSGSYHAICVNMGTGANRLANELDSYEVFAITTRADGNAGQIILEPDILYSDHTREAFNINEMTQQTLVMYPEQRTPRYTVIVRNIHNLNWARCCQASLSGLSCGYMVAKGTPSDAIHSQTFEMSRADETTLQGGITIFGHNHSECRDHILTLQFTLQDGMEFTFTADVTTRMEQLAREGSMSGQIIVDLPVCLPKPISNGSGFQPTVDEWNGEEIELSL